MTVEHQANHIFSILLVEDDDNHAALLQRALRGAIPEFSITHLRDGSEAMRFLEQQPPYETEARPDLVLLDLKLPGMDGHGVLQRIKAHEDLRTIPVVILSTSAAAKDRRRAYQNLANSYLVKPMDPAEFRSMVHALGAYWLRWNQLPAD